MRARLLLVAFLPLLLYLLLIVAALLGRRRVVLQVFLRILLELLDAFFLVEVDAG